MTRRLLRTSVLTVLVIPLLLVVAPAGATSFALVRVVRSVPGSGSNPSQASAQSELVEKIAFTSTRDNPNAPAQLNIYLMNPDGTNPEQLTSRDDCLPTLRAVTVSRPCRRTGNGSCLTATGIRLMRSPPTPRTCS